MKNLIKISFVVLIIVSVQSCKKQDYSESLTDKYLHRVYLNEELESEYHYTDKKLTAISFFRDKQNYRNDLIEYNDLGKVSKVSHIYSDDQYNDHFIDYSYDNEGNLIYVVDNIYTYDTSFKLEYDSQGRLERSVCFKSLPDSVYYYHVYEYEGSNISEIKWYEGDDNYIGNLTFSYDSKKNPDRILKDIYSYGHNVYKYQENNVINTESDVLMYDGYASFEFESSISVDSRWGGVMIPLENYFADIKYLYDLEGYLKYKITKPYAHPEKVYVLRYDYIRM